MHELEFIVDDWLGAAHASDPADVTLASLRIEAGQGHERVAFTEVEDAIASTVRRHVNVPVSDLVVWLLSNWWRLRWEPRRDSPAWRLAHSLASLGGGSAWPSLELSSDGEFIQLHLEAESQSDVAAVRYLRSATIDLPAIEFERAVDDLVARTQERLSACHHPTRVILDLRDELQSERSEKGTARACRLQAQAGLDPGAAPEGWLEDAEALSASAGPGALDEVLAVLPDLERGLDGARRAIDDIRRSVTKIRLDWVDASPPAPGLLPWQRGAHLAATVRRHLGVDAERPITDAELGGWLDASFPMAASTRRPLTGAFRNGDRASVAVGVPMSDPVHQRFFVSRLACCDLLSTSEDHLLPVTRATTAMQKAQRSFAQEFLCPWAALDEFTESRGLDDEAISQAAEHFRVSELVVLTTLVNKKNLPRQRLLSR